MSTPDRPMTWAPSPALERATREALAALARHRLWASTISPALERSEAGRALFHDYAHALRHCHLQAIPLAVREWIDTQHFAPVPADLASIAREISAKQFPAEVIPLHGEPGPPPIADGKDRKRVAELSNRALREMGTWPLVSAVWLRLLRDPATEPKVRAGTVSDAEFDAAIAAEIKAIADAAAKALEDAAKANEGAAA